MAEAVMRAYVEAQGGADRFELLSAGTGSWHLGASADPRAVAACHQRGIDLGSHRASHLEAHRLDTVDMVICMDRANLLDVKRLSADTVADRSVLLLDYHPTRMGEDVPDPYYGDASDFEHALDLCQQACAGLYQHCQREGGKGWQ